LEQAPSPRRVGEEAPATGRRIWRFYGFASSPNGLGGRGVEGAHLPGGPGTGGVGGSPLHGGWGRRRRGDRGRGGGLGRAYWPVCAGSHRGPQVQYIYIINTVVVRTTRHMDHRSVDIYIYPMHMPGPTKPWGRGPPGGPGGGGRSGGLTPKARPKDLSRDFTTFQTTKYPKCHSAFRKSGPLCMVFLSCTVHPHTKIVPRSNF
jgi:hypothetical protein